MILNFDFFGAVNRLSMKASTSARRSESQQLSKRYAAQSRLAVSIRVRTDPVRRYGEQFGYLEYVQQLFKGRRSGAVVRVNRRICQ